MGEATRAQSTLDGPPTSKAAKDGAETWHGDGLGFVVHVGPGQTVVATGILTARSRGELRLAGVTASSGFPFGIFRKSVWFESPARITVWPRELAPPRGVFERVVGQLAGARSRLTVGAGEEFHALREYVPGDSPRSVAWKASARGGPLLVRQMSAVAPAQVWVVVRLVTGADEENEAAISLAAGVTRMAGERGLRVGLAVPEAGVTVPARSGPPHHSRILDELAVLRIKEGGPDGLPLGVVRSRAACVVVHGARIDRGYGPAWATHVSASGAADEPGPGERE